MGKPQRRFGKEIEAEAVRLVEVSGRTQREIAMDLGVGLSTLRRWLDKRREHEIEAPPPDLRRRLVLPQPDVNRVSQQVVGRPGQIGYLGHKLRLDPGRGTRQAASRTGSCGAAERLRAISAAPTDRDAVADP